MNADEWETPQDLFIPLHCEFAFTIDVAANECNTKMKRFFSIKENALIQDWKGETCWMNPPYGKDLKLWIAKAYREWRDNGVTVVALLPASTDTKWFHRYIYDQEEVEIRFLQGRIEYKSDRWEKRNRARFASMIVIWRGEEINQ